MKKQVNNSCLESLCCDYSTCTFRLSFYKKTCSMSRAPSRSGDRTPVPLWSSRMDRTAWLRSARFSSEHRDATSLQTSTEDSLSSRITPSKTPERTETHRGHLKSGVDSSLVCFLCSPCFFCSPMWDSYLCPVRPCKSSRH